MKLLFDEVFLDPLDSPQNMRDHQRGRLSLSGDHTSVNQWLEDNTAGSVMKKVSGYSQEDVPA